MTSLLDVLGLSSVDLVKDSGGADEIFGVEPSADGHDCAVYIFQMHREMSRAFQ